MCRALVSVAIVALLFAAGCSPPPRGAQTAPEADVLKVALLSPGPVNDAGWNALGYAGLKAVEKELGAAISQKQADSKGEFEADFREFANEGFDVVIGHGYEMQPAALKARKDYPNTVFVITAGNKVEGNVVPVIPKLEEATYLLGVLAAKMSKTGTAGLVGGMEIPPIKSTFEAFTQGAKSANSSFSVRSSYIGNWHDTASAKEATLSLINQGCDFVFHNADAAGLGVIQACADSGKAYALGSNSNQNNVAPDVVLASAVLEIPKMFVEICESVKAGSFKSQEYRLTIANGYVSLVYNSELKERVPEDVLQEVESLRKKIVSGDIKVERAHFGD